MKKKIIYYTIGLFALLSTACTDLEDKSYSLIISEDFEPTPEDLSSLVGTAYGTWRECLYRWDNYIRVMELTTDESIVLSIR